MFERLRPHRYWYRAKYALERYTRAFAYARGRLTQEQAQRMVYDIEPPSGWYHLLTLSVDDTMVDALERFKPHPELRDLVAEACQEVGSAWQCHDDSYGNARHWAVDKVQEWAKERGIALELTEDWADLRRTFEAPASEEAG